MNFNEIADCVLRSAEGDTKAFEKLYKLTNRRIYFICLNLLKNEHDANDAVQDSFLTAYKNIRQLSEPGKFAQWIERIAVNRCKDIIKKKTPVPVDDDILKETLLAEDELSLSEDFILNSEKRKILMDIIRNRLSDLQFQTVILYYYTNMTVAEIAEIMECSEGAVKNRLSTARSKIRKGVEEYDKGKTPDSKMFVFVGIPFLSQFFYEECKGMKVPDFSSEIAKALSSSKADVTSKNNGKAAKDLQKIFKNFVGVHRTAAVVTAAAVVVVGAAIGIGAAAKGDNKPDVHGTGEKPSVSSSSSDKTARTTSAASEAMTSEELTYYTELSDKIKTNIDTLMKAMSEGDLETLLDYADPDSEEAEFYNTMKDSKELSEIIRAFYGDCTWRTDSVTPEAVKKALDNAEKYNDDTVSIYYDVGSRMFEYYMAYDFSTHKKGDVVPHSSVYKQTREESWAAYRKVIDAMPLICSEWQLSITIPDSDGNFNASLNRTDFSNVVTYGILYTDHKDDENMISYFLSGACADGYITEPEKLPARYDDSVDGLRSQIGVLLTDKDFEGARQLLTKERGEDYAHLQDWSYDKAPEEQRKYVDDYINNMKMIPTVTGWYGLSDNSDPEYVLIEIIMEGDVLTNSYTEEYKVKWIEENNLKTVKIISPTSSAARCDTIEGLQTETLNYYSQIVKFAK